MGMTIDNLCNSCTNIGCEFQSGIVRTKCVFYMPPQLESDNCGNYVVQALATKNDLGVDCISRTSALDSINWAYNLSDAYQKINDVPSVTPQPRKGHWIPTYGNVKCSVCGSVKDSRNVGKATHYCDFCGATMVEPQESEEV